MTLEIHAAIKRAVEAYEIRKHAEARLQLEWQKGKPSVGAIDARERARARHEEAERALTEAIQREGLAK